MSYFRYAAIAGAVILVILVVKAFEKLNRRYGLSDALCAWVGDPWASWIMRLAFMATVALVAGLAQLVGFIVPAEVEQFIPNEWTTVIMGILAMSSYRTGNKGAKAKIADASAGDEVTVVASAPDSGPYGIRVPTPRTATDEGEGME
jgi:hypothetical protein